MPNRNWVPIIGRDFSDVGGQVYNWSNFNRGVEEANIGRMNQRDAEARNYYANLANIRRENQRVAQQLSLDERARAEDAAARAERNRIAQYQFGKSMEADKARLDLTRDQNRLQADDIRARRIEAEQDAAAKQAYQFAVSGMPLSQQPESLTRALNQQQRDTGDTYFTIGKQERDRLAAETAQRVTLANQAIEAERIRKAFDAWKLTPDGIKAARVNPTQSALRQVFLATSPALPELDATELSAIAGKNRFDKLDAPWDEVGQRYVFGQNPQSATIAPTTQTGTGDVDLSPYEGKIINQGGQRYRIVNGTPVPL